ncbi:MAG: hypothetical protein CMD25_07865 [Flavobacteriales bacterium]|nr:hypothetical protein [Flavobacteriales bacterium]
MADKVPLKGLFDNSGNVTGLAEYRSADGDTLGVIHGGTGLATVATDRILTGNGTSAMTAEANLTFDGTTLTVTGNIVATGNFEAQTQITTVDPVLLIDSGRSGNPAGTDDAGIIIERGSDPNVSIFWDESEQHFSFATTTDTGAGTDNTISVSQQTAIKAGNITSTGNLAISGTLTGVTNFNLTGTLQFDSGQTVDEISNDVNLTDGAATALVTENAIKSHVTAQASAFAIALG